MEYFFTSLVHTLATIKYVNVVIQIQIHIFWFRGVFAKIVMQILRFFVISDAQNEH